MLRRHSKTPISLEIGVSIRQFLSDYDSSSIKTKEAYADNLGAFQVFSNSRGLTVLDEIDAQVLRDYIQYLREYTYMRPRSTVVKHLSVSTIQHRQGVVRTWLRWCVQQGQMQVSPMDLVRAVKGESRARHAFTPEEVKKLVLESGKGVGWLGHRDRAIILLLLGTGCRASELLTLTPQHFEWKSLEGPEHGRRGPENRVLLNGKGAMDRRVKLGERTAPAVREWFKQRPKWQQRDPLSALFWTIRKEPMEYSALLSMTKMLGGYAGVDDCTPHRFRHTFAVDFYRKNKDIMALRTRLGHAKIETTQHYLHSLGVDYGGGDDYMTPDEMY